MIEEEEKIKVRAIIEMLGAPKEYIEKTIRDFIEKLKKDYEIQTTKYEPAKENGSLFSTFCEVEVLFKDIEESFHFCMNAMPSSMEILEPHKLKIPNSMLTRVFNDLQSKIHEIDMELKRLKSLNEVLDRNSLQTFRNFIQFTLKKQPKPIEEISNAVGVKKENLKPFLDRMIEENYLLFESNSYFLPKKKNG